MKNLFSYEGKRCLITGCFSGMGEATARIVQSLGGEVVPVDIKKPTTFPFEKFYEVDLKDPVAIEQMVADLFEPAAMRPTQDAWLIEGMEADGGSSITALRTNIPGGDNLIKITDKVFEFFRSNGRVFDKGN